MERAEKLEPPKLNGPSSIPIILDFTVDVNIAEDGKALVVDVLKTNLLAMACKNALHITIAYNGTQDFLEHIVDATSRWIGNLHIHQKIASLRRWGERSDIIEGPFNVEV